MTVEHIDPTTGEVLALTEAEARRLTERIRVALDRVSHAWADLAERITEAYQRRADLAMGYGSWAEYAEAELKPSEGLAADVRRQLVGMLSAQGMSTRAIAPTVGVTHKTVVIDSQAIRTQVVPDVPPATRTDEMREVLAAAERDARIVKLTGPESVSNPGKITGLDGKTYTRPESRTSQRDYAPEPKQGTDLHALRYGVIPALDAWSAAWTPKTLLDNTVTADEAAQLLRDLSRLTPVLSQIRRLLNSRMESTE